MDDRYTPKGLKGQGGRGGRDGGRQPYRGGGGPSRPVPDRARAAYNFVPADARVVFPDWKEQVSHDVPFSDGFSGHMELEVRAETPLFVRDGKDRQSFFRLPGGLYGVPGTSIKGMLRTVLQIASFGKLTPVNDHRYGVRDLHNRELYGKHMAEIRNGQPVPLVSAGWLQEKHGEEYEEDGLHGETKWEIVPCHFAKIEYTFLQKLAAERGVKGFNPGMKQSAPRKYQAWGAASLDVDCSVEILDDARSREEGKPAAIGSYGRVVGLGGDVRGRLVFTGQPSEHRPDAPKRSGAGNPKHHDFMFFGEVGTAVVVPAAQRRDFPFVHGNAGEQHRLDSDPNPEWKHMLGRMRQGERVPVFFLLDERGELRAFGLAMMFRLAYKMSTRDAVTSTQPDAQDDRHDLAELVFGRVHRGKGKDSASQALRGRVSIETAVAEGSPQPLPLVTGVLGAPKASFYPNYLVQGKDARGEVARGLDGKPRYQTYMDDGVRVRGWKRYPQREAVEKLPPPPTSRDGRVNEEVASKLAPLPAGTVFTTRVHIHNLRRVELGALLWTLDFGGREHCRHGLGMAKAFGYGGVRLEITRATLQPNDPAADAAIDLAALRDEFRGYMEARLDGGWETSESIYQLLALATPVPKAQAVELRHMRLDHPEFRNEFQGVKQAGKALPPHGDAQGRKKHREACLANPAPAARTSQLQQSSPTGDAPSSAGPAVEEEPCVKAAREARARDEHLKLFKQWMLEGGPDEALRRKAARTVMGEPSKKWIAKNQELWAWMNTR